MTDQAAHPIWACDDDAIKDEYQRALDDAKKWQDWHARTDSEAERLHWLLGRIVSAWLEAVEPNASDHDDALADAIGEARDHFAESVQSPQTPEDTVHGKPERCPKCGSDDPGQRELVRKTDLPGGHQFWADCTDPWHERPG